MITSLPTKCISAISQWKSFLRVLPTRWRWKPAGIEITSLSPYVLISSFFTYLILMLYCGNTSRRIIVIAHQLEVVWIMSFPMTLSPNPIQSNSSMHHYECIALCKDISLQRGRFCARSLASRVKDQTVSQAHYATKTQTRDGNGNATCFHVPLDTK